MPSPWPHHGLITASPWPRVQLDGLSSMEELFNAIDTNRDGVLDRNEFAAMVFWP